jgi:BlaI family penicillinase repressor
LMSRNEAIGMWVECCQGVARLDVSVAGPAAHCSRDNRLTPRRVREYIRCARNNSPCESLRSRMPGVKTVDLTRRESQIMEILYRRRRATVEEIRSELPDAPSPSSVRKLLDIMIDRGLLAREYDGPRYVYFPAVKPEQASRSALRQLVRTFFDNSPGSAMAALLDMTSTRLSAAEYRRLRSLLDRVREQGDEP